MVSPAVSLPPWIVDFDLIPDEASSPSSDLQRDTAEDCLPLLTRIPGSGKLPKLERRKHAAFLKAMLGHLPSPYTALDASRPWMLYWSLNGLALLGEDMSTYCESLVTTLRPLQNLGGGFGGGHGQFSHLAPTYAAVLSLLIVGGSDAFDLVDRDAMWRWVGRLKQPGGEFAICEGGERDTRAAYCALVMLSLFNLPLALPPDSPARLSGYETFMDGLPEWIGRCQGFDGGIANAPGSESHGAYTFCALACLCILGDPHEVFSRYLDVDSLTRWLAYRQHAPEGGCAGRANKLVDGCYSHWIGGCWPLVEAAINKKTNLTGESSQVDHDLFNKEALIRYILCCCQASTGGLRDKPHMRPDAYHSCYNMAGLSFMQNVHAFEPTQANQQQDLASGFAWTSAANHPGHPTERYRFDTLFSEEERVSLLNPVYVVPQVSLANMTAYFATRDLKP